jgi:hypothetical protein
VQLAPIPVQSRPDLGHHLGNGEPQPACSLDDYATVRPTASGVDSLTSHIPDGVCTTGTGIRPSFAQAHAVW